MAITFTAGQLVTAAELNLLAGQYAAKTSTQTVTNSTTLVPDNDLVFTLAPFQTYQLEINLEATSSAVNHGILVGYATTGTVTLVGRQGLGPVFQAAAGASTSTLMHSFGFNSTSAAAYGTDTGTSQVWEKLILTGGLSGGTVVVQWAQNTSGAATTTSLFAGSHGVLRCVA